MLDVAGNHTIDAPSVVKVVYIIVTVLVALAWLGGIVAAFQASVWAGILYLAFGAVLLLVAAALLAGTTYALIEWGGNGAPWAGAAGVIAAGDPPGCAL